MDKDTIESLVRDNVTFAKFKEVLAKMVSGAYCLHRSFGIGQIKGRDEETGKLIIEFESQGKRLMDPVFCAQKLDILANDDLLVDFCKHPDEVRQELKKSSVELLLKFLNKSPNHRASLGDIERTFGRIVEEKNFKRWWSATKKLIAKEPHLQLEEGTVVYLSIREEPISEKEIFQHKFILARDLGSKIAVGEKFLQAFKANPDFSDVAKEMIQVLSDGISEKSKKVTAAERFQACVLRDELARYAEINVDDLNPKIESLMTGFVSLAKVCDSLQPSYYEKFLKMITRVFPDEWEKICLNILKNCNDRLTNECMSYLKENGCEELLQTMLAKWLKEKSLRSSLLQWILRNRHSKKFAEVFSDELLCPELLRSIFWAIDNEALQGSGKAHKIQLVELLCNDRSLIKDLLNNASEDVAMDLAQTLLINQGIDSLSKKSLMARFIAIFPATQELLANASKAKLPQDATLKVSLASLENKRKEYDILVKEKIPANKLAIETAREHGDLSENSEYKMARQDQDTLLARKSQLESELEMAQVIDFSAVDTSMVSIGSIVKVRQTVSNEEVEFTILGAWDSDPAHNVISYKTAMAQALLGKKVKDVVSISTENANETWEIKSIRAYEEKKA